MKIAPLYEVKNSLSQYVAEVDESPVIITKNGKPRAALVTLEGEDLESFILAHSPRFLHLLDQAVNQAKQSGFSLSEIEAEVTARETRLSRKTKG